MFKFLAKLFNGAKPAKSLDRTPPSEWPTKSSVQVIANNNKDIISGFELIVTMLPRVPLKLLRRHGEVSKKIPAMDADLSPSDGLWLPMLDEAFSSLDDGATMWSPAGHIPTDGAEVLQYLISARQIIEAPLPLPLSEISEALSRLKKVKSLPGGPRYTSDNDYRIIRSNETEDYFPLFFGDDDKALNLILMEIGAPSHDGLSYEHILELHSKGWNSISEILNAPDEVLLVLKGIGKKKLEKIRGNLMSARAC